MATQIGYKSSELGMIPQDWEVEELGTVAKVEMCRRIFKNETLNVGDIPFYKIGTFGGEADAYISRQLFEEYKSKYPYPKIGDVLISAAGTIGRVVVFDGEEAYYQDSNIVWLNINKAKISNSFLYYFYQYTEWNSLEGSTIKRLYNNDLLSKKIAIPKSTTEQTAIAIALSDTDALISSLQTLIAKKQAIKLSAMQNLLSGKIRLPEFAQRPDGSPKTTRQTELGCVPEDWEVVELGDVGKTYGGLSGKNKSDFDKGNSFYVPFTNVMANLEVDKNQLGKVEVNEKQNEVLEGDLLFNGSSETPEEVCFASFVNFSLPNLFLNSFCFGFRLTKNTVHPKYLAYWFRSEIGRKTIAFMSQGSTRYNVSKSEFVKLKLVMPSKPEQTAIAQLLSDMDSEIEALECRLKKTQSLKQGMMQALLTGKIRLPLE